MFNFMEIIHLIWKTKFSKVQIIKYCKSHTVKVSFLARDRERTVPMYIPDIYQNEKLNQKKHGHAPRTKLSLYKTRYSWNILM